MAGKTIAEQWSKLFTTVALDDGEQRVVFTREALDGAVGYEILSEIIRSLQMGEDFAYEQVQNALEAIAEDGLEDVECNLYEYCDTAVDIYTANLTTWLASNVNHVYYLTDAILNSAKDGFDALMQAQGAAIEEIWQAVIGAVWHELDMFDPFYDGA